ncbi:hypothetical protein RhiirA5_495586 [Rhizophagus irregularis]|uniref:Uncharacterized protein n=1 Tax=Rhizophagus irregularis TaxID=588596 RepID=A0A2N0Q534_9GLOM|nr:hypothetical protein RhiirA5_495586 [Rhizophagus irregularis]
MKKTLLLRSAIVWNRFLTEGKGQNETTSNEATPAKLMEKLLLNISIQTFTNLQNKKTIATCSTTASCIILFRPVLTEQQQVKRDEGKDCDQDPSSKKSENKWDIMKSNILPNKEANVIKRNFYADQLIPAGIKDLFNSANRETVMATAIAEMGQKLKKEQLEVEKERWVYKRERSRIEFELRIKELDLKF